MMLDVTVSWILFIANYMLKQCFLEFNLDVYPKVFKYKFSIACYTASYAICIILSSVAGTKNSSFMVGVGKTRRNMPDPTRKVRSLCLKSPIRVQNQTIRARRVGGHEYKIFKLLGTHPHV